MHLLPNLPISVCIQISVYTTRAQRRSDNQKRLLLQFEPNGEAAAWQQKQQPFAPSNNAVKPHVQWLLNGLALQCAHPSRRVPCRQRLILLF